MGPRKGRQCQLQHHQWAYSYFQPGTWSFAANWTWYEPRNLPFLQPDFDPGFTGPVHWLKVQPGRSLDDPPSGSIIVATMAPAVECPLHGIELQCSRVRHQHQAWQEQPAPFCLLGLAGGSAAPKECAWIAALDTYMHEAAQVLANSVEGMLLPLQIPVKRHLQPARAL